MIVSHRHRFIFLKTSKTAGTSVEIALSRYCGPNDVITRLAPRDESYREAQGYPGAQNYLGDDGNARFFNHQQARSARRLLGRKIWDSYYKFCVVRDPWERFLSHYYWLYRKPPRPGYAAALEMKSSQRLVSNGFQVYTIDGEVAVDHLVRFENLQSDLDAVAEHLQLPGPVELPRAKSGYRKDDGARKALGPAEIGRIAYLCRQEVSLLGYRPPLQSKE